MASDRIQKIISRFKSTGLIGKLLLILRLPFLVAILMYQKTFSPDHGIAKGLFPYGYCRFNPSCSDYGFEAILKYGLIIGGYKSIYRIIRCNPWNEGGHDPLK